MTSSSKNALAFILGVTVVAGGWAADKYWVEDTSKLPTVDEVIDNKVDASGFGKEFVMQVVWCEDKECKAKSENFYVFPDEDVCGLVGAQLIPATNIVYGVVCTNKSLFDEKHVEAPQKYEGFNDLKEKLKEQVDKLGDPVFENAPNRQINEEDESYI